MLSRALDIHGTLDKPKDREWIHILLSYLKTYVECLGNELLLHEQDKVDYVDGFVNALKTASEKLDAGIVTSSPFISLHPLCV